MVEEEGEVKDDNEDSDEEEDESETKTVRANSRHQNGKVPRIFVDRGTEGLRTPELRPRPRREPIQLLLNKAGRPPPAAQGTQGAEEMLDKICDPLDSFFDKSDVGAVSGFSEDFESAPGSAIPRPPGPFQGPVPCENEDRVGAPAVSCPLEPVVPQKRLRELDVFESAILQPKDFQNESAL
ncbi:hypothetical protein BU26DRAFT_572154 [Trematosphaeria pertusa]|uniref:Uncharacterized protein n=1 Tax=Trematosphaeria pertusa TaxID=390896 RepID=A0A6A6HU09_9PLEO|nr:uncharacterized protein BU26DRAFT_572154 [Trematosphaeria pertusa]KAF2240910.1 hypothetical protein BU26DRAFT_572154 [Trematosphaeria pertusa]